MFVRINSMDISLAIGSNLKKLRNERGLSLGQLSKLCDVSKMMLSQIEKGKSSPTINTIWKIASGLNIPYTILLEQPISAAQILTKEDVVHQCSEDGNYEHYCYYPNTPVRNFELFQMILKVGGMYRSRGHSEKSEEYILVTTGELTIEIDGKKYLLFPDNTMTFNAAKEHSYANNGNDTVKAMIINYYPVKH